MVNHLSFTIGRFCLAIRGFQGVKEVFFPWGKGEIFMCAWDTVVIMMIMLVTMMTKTSRLSPIRSPNMLSKGSCCMCLFLNLNYNKQEYTKPNKQVWYLGSCYTLPEYTKQNQQSFLSFLMHKSHPMHHTPN